MILYVDDFLPQDQFQALKNRIIKRFVATDKKKFDRNSDEPVRFKMHRHSDGSVKGAPIDRCFTSLLFCHEYWDDDWGGILHLSSLNVLDKIPLSPKPNTMVMWTRDHPIG